MVWSLGVDLRASAVPKGPLEEGAITEPAQDPNGNYRKFSHTGGKHAQLPCLLCHQRKDNSTKPAFSGHLPCTGCHVEQFKNPSSGICSVCHQNEQGGPLKAFPGLRSFSLRFDHGRHTMGRGRPSAGCVICHGGNSRGPARSIPAGASAHATCFQCHTPQAKNAGGAGISSCDTCHQIGTAARISTWAPAFRVGFSHAKHTNTQGLNCADCHTVRPGAVRGRQVSAPSPLQHHAKGPAQSCITCHNGKRTFGGDDFTSCKRCHQGTRFYF